MDKRGVLIEIPGFGGRMIHNVVSDFTGTCSLDGKLTPGLRERFLELERVVDIHIVTADTFGTAAEQLSGLPLVLKKLTTGDEDVQKRDYVRKLDARRAAVFGNGNNDQLLLKEAREAGGLAIAVDNGEGCAVFALLNANLFVVGATNAFDLLLEPRRCTATLRF
jgi:soluble P-type ATPase